MVRELGLRDHVRICHPLIFIYGIILKEKFISKATQVFRN